jgi:hypothetical protein
VKNITMYDLRATGITWRTLRCDDTRKIQREAGHEDYGTTDGDVRDAAVSGNRLGEVFPPLPVAFRSRFLITGGQDSRSGLFSAEKVTSPRGSDTLLTGDGGEIRLAVVA